MAGERLVVLPVQRLRLDDSATAGAVNAAAAAAALRGVDSALATAGGARGAAWAFGPEVARSARRNPTHSPDPFRLAVNPLLPGRRPPPDGAIPDPLASQLRTVVALNDARYALVPAELRVQPGTARARRASCCAWRSSTRGRRSCAGRASVASDPAPAGAPPFSSTAAAALAARFADLIAAP
jgi:hypothetical protein